MRVRPIASVTLALSATACTVGPDYRQPAVLTGTATTPPLIEAQTSAYTGEPLPADWWRLYADPTLDALVTKALVRNTDLRAALATLAATQATLRETELERTPQTVFQGSATYGQESADESGASQALKPGAVYMLGEMVSYDVDLFGRIRRSIEAGKADVGAGRAALDVARINVAAQTAGAYVGVCSAGLQIAVTRRSIAVARTILDVIQRRYAGGINGINDVVRARTLLRQTEATLPTFLAQQRSNLYMLATLTGDAPEAFPAAVAACDAPPILRRPIPVGDGTALLKRRPDVRAAERKLAASVAQIGVSTTALYPSVTLGGLIGTTATSLPDIVKDRAFRWNLGPLVSWSFPNIAITKAEIAASTAQARGALASFDGTVLTALRETETALVTLARTLDNERELMLARDDAALASRNVQRLYAGGVGEFIDVLDSERTTIQADAALAASSAQVSQNQVSLFLALGGGWQNAPAPAETPLEDVTTPHRRLPRH